MTIGISREYTQITLQSIYKNQDPYRIRVLLLISAVSAGYTIRKHTTISSYCFSMDSLESLITNESRKSQTTSSLLHYVQFSDIPTAKSEHLL